MLQKGPPHILVTVGTTEFDSLIEYACSEDFLEMLKRLGLQKTKITYQIGATGKFIPQNAEYFRLSNDIQAVYDSHQIIFTHGGAGTLLACLDSPNKKKKIIAVANETLAGNHQTELISKLGDQGYLLGFENVLELKKSEARVTQYLQGLLPSKEYEDSGKNLLNHVIFGQDL